ncbi:MAG: hypothetical protein KDB07_08130 [Planctomycetes bacterium]|nr:hypothetical protein [Planctomycetota bacterium]
MYKSILLTKEAYSLGGGFAEPPATVLRTAASKIASYTAPLHPILQAFIQALKPDSNSTYVLVNAMGAGEWYGDNINGDYFPYSELVNHTDEWLGLPVDDYQNRRAAAGKIGWGYPTFINAHPFKHHVNKDPAKAYGEVMCAVWNERMKRVELVVRLDHELCRRNNGMDILNRILDGEFPDVSMGCKVPYDVCSICGNKARTKEDYCEHIRNRRMNRDPRGDGQRPYMINIRPRFFDISFVFIGADKTARTLMKIASYDSPVYQHIIYDVHSNFPQLSEYHVDKVASGLFVAGYDPYAQEQYSTLEKAASLYVPAKTASVATDAVRKYLQFEAVDPLLSKNEKYRRIKNKLRQVKLSGLKLADIIKYVVPNPDARSVSRLEGGEPDLPPTLLDQLGEAGLPEALNATARKGIVLKLPEFARIALVSSGLRGLADRLQNQEFGESEDVELPCDCELDSCGEDLDEELDPFVPARSILPPIVRRREIHIIMVSPGAPEPEKTVESSVVQKNRLMNKISAAYNGYRLWLLSNAQELGYFEKDAGVSLESSFGGGFEPISEDSLELTSAYLERAHWQAGGRFA